MKKLFTLFVLCLAACTPSTNKTQDSAEKQDELTFYYRGLIDQAFVDNLKTLTDEPITLYLASNGGGADMGLAAANVMLQKNIHLVIDGKYGICASGCAEFIVPAANSVEFINTPLIGYHQNPQLIFHILKDKATEELEHCGFIKSEVNATEGLLNQKGLKTDLWKETLDRIDLEYTQIYLYNGHCPWLSKRFAHELWFPTSTQLRDMLGLEFKGKLCADTPECYEPNIDRFWPAGMSFVAGDTIYVSKGQERD